MRKKETLNSSITDDNMTDRKRNTLNVNDGDKTDRSRERGRKNQKQVTISLKDIQKYNLRKEESRKIEDFKIIEESKNEDAPLIGD